MVKRKSYIGRPGSPPARLSYQVRRSVQPLPPPPPLIDPRLVEYDNVEAWCYIGRRVCGCVTFLAVILDREDTRNEMADLISEAVKLGEVIDRIPVEVARKVPWLCQKHEDEERADKVLQAMQGKLRLEE